MALSGYSGLVQSRRHGGVTFGGLVPQIELWITTNRLHFYQISERQGPEQR